LLLLAAAVGGVLAVAVPVGTKLARLPWLPIRFTPFLLALAALVITAKAPLEAFQASRLFPQLLVAAAAGSAPLYRMVLTVVPVAVGAQAPQARTMPELLALVLLGREAQAG
jgi:hypothetical protein